MRPFEYTQSHRLEDALALLRADGDGSVRPLAGGTDLLTLMKADLIAPARLVDIKRLPGLGGITGHKDFARPTGVYVKPEDATAVADGIVRVFTANGDRTDRKKARLKYLLDAWGFEKFLAEVEKVLGRSLARVPDELVMDVLDWLAERGFGEVAEVTTAQEKLVFSLPKALTRDMKEAAAARAAEAAALVAGSVESTSSVRATSSVQTTSSGA